MDRAVIDQTRKIFDEKTSIFQPSIAEGTGTPKPVSLTEFTNDFKQHVSGQPLTSVGKVKIQHGNREYSLNVPVSELMEAFKVLIDDVATSDGKYMAPLEFKSRSMHLFKAIPNFVQQVRDLLEFVKALGLHYMDLNFFEKEDRYFTCMPLADVIAFMDAVENSSTTRQEIASAANGKHTPPGAMSGYHPPRKK